MSRPLKIDLHTHILPKSWPDLDKLYGCAGFVRLEHHAPGRARMMRGTSCFREISDNCWDPARRLEDMDRTGVDLQVLSTVPVLFSYWAKGEHALDFSRLLNDHIASVVRERPKRFAGLGTIPLQAPDLAVRELERCVKELGLAGIQIGSHAGEWNLGEKQLFPIFEAAAALRAAVFIHPWDMPGGARMDKYWLSWLVGMPAETAQAICSVIFGGVLERLPSLRIAFAHGGGSFPGTLGRIEHGFRVRPDLCAIDNSRDPRVYLGRFFVDSLVHDPEALKTLIRLFGAGKVALGSDYPFPLGEHHPGALIESAELPAKTRTALLSGAALEFLGRDSDAFVR